MPRPIRHPSEKDKPGQASTCETPSLVGRMGAMLIELMRHAARCHVLANTPNSIPEEGRRHLRWATSLGYKPAPVKREVVATPCDVTRCFAGELSGLKAANETYTGQSIVSGPSYITVGQNRTPNTKPPAPLRTTDLQNEPRNTNPKSNCTPDCATWCSTEKRALSFPTHHPHALGHREAEIPKLCGN